jgi:mannose-6-phosphate isomerase-like protein (cupin superfamily)
MPPLAAPSIRRFDPASEFDTPERCAIVELSNAASDPQVSIARARVAPGVTTAWHRLHGIAERYLLLEGRGRVEVGDLPPAEIGPGDVVLIPPGCRQRIANVGEADLVFVAVCTPRFVPDAYESLD